MNLNRPELQAAALVAMLLVPTGCATAKTTPVSEIKAPVAITTPASKNNPVTTPLPPDIRQYYPSIEKEPLTAAGELNISGTNVKWRNFTSQTINPDSLKKLLEYLNSLASTQSIYSGELNGSEVQFKVQPRDMSNRFIYYIPSNTAQPAWFPSAKMELAGTRGYADEKRSLTFIREGFVSNNIDHESLNKNPELSFQVEGCQTMIQVGVRRPHDPLAGQEAFCHSLGLAIFLKQQGVTHEGYARLAKIYDVDLPNLPKVILPAGDYERMPTLPKIVTD